FQDAVILADLTVELGLPAAYLFLSLRQLIFLSVEGLHFLVEVRLLLGEALFCVLELVLLVSYFLFQLVSRLDNDVLSLNRSLSLGNVGFLLGILQYFLPDRLILA